MSQAPRDRLTHLLPMGRPADDPFVEPEVTAQGAIRLEQAERILYEGDHPVSVQWFNESAGFLGNKSQWEDVVVMEKKAHVVITSSRVVYTWPKWKSDKASGSFFERRIMTAVMERDEGKMALGGHVRQQWISRVFVRNPSGMLTKTSAVRVDVQDGNLSFLVQVGGIEPATAAAVGRDLAASVAALRLAQRSTIKPEAKNQLQGIATKTAQPKVLDWARQYALPAGMKVGFDFPTD